ncbi:hypothetical protein D3C80_1671340 [compost metagenome]
MDPAIAAIGMQQPVHAVQVRRFARHVDLMGKQGCFAILRVQTAFPEFVFIVEAFARQAEQVGEARRVEHLVGAQVPIPDAVLDRFERPVQALFALLHGRVGAGLALCLAEQEEIQDDCRDGEEDVLLVAHPAQVFV